MSDEEYKNTMPGKDANQKKKCHLGKKWTTIIIVLIIIVILAVLWRWFEMRKQHATPHDNMPSPAVLKAATVPSTPNSMPSEKVLKDATVKSNTGYSQPSAAQLKAAGG